MRLFELIESKSKADKLTIPAKPPRDFHAKAVTRKTGSGRHTNDKKRDPKHKGKLPD